MVEASRDALRELPPDLEERVREGLARAEREHWAQRIWAHDASLWTGGDEGKWLGWLASTDGGAAKRYAPLRELGESGGFDHALLLGMGGSSLGPEVLGATLGPAPGFPALRVLDSTHPGQVRALESELDLARTLFLVSSKSGTTLEPSLLLDHFHAKLAEQLGGEEAGRRFLAVTDPGSALERQAAELGFREVFAGVPSIGGRFSVLSPFGLVPAALCGLDLAALLERAGAMARACAQTGSAEANPGVALGVCLGALAEAGRDKVTLFASPGVARLGAWLEQLLAESTGKEGRALLPVEGERPAGPEHYGEDRVFVYLREARTHEPPTDAAVRRLAEAGHPVLRIELRDGYDLGREFFRFEFATAVAGAVLGVNPFDQPDVEASKEATRALTQQIEEEGALPEEEPLLVADGEPALAFHAGESHRRTLEASAGGAGDAAALLRAHLATLGAGDYLALLAYLPMTPEHEAPLQALRHRVRDATRAATALGFGPRFLHSTGQAYKGGPNTGVFLEVTADTAQDLALPGRRATLGQVNAAQALGDFRVLGERGRRALRVHVRGDAAAGLERLDALVAEALERA